MHVPLRKNDTHQRKPTPRYWSSKCPYQFIPGEYVTNDYAAAKANYLNAAAACQQLGQYVDPRPVETRAALATYRIMRERLLDVRQYVSAAGGHPELPATPSGVVDPDAVTCLHPPEVVLATGRCVSCGHQA